MTRREPLSQRHSKTLRLCIKGELEERRGKMTPGGVLKVKVNQTELVSPNNIL